MRPQVFQKGHPVHSGQVEVQKDQVIGFDGEFFPSLIPVIAKVHAVALLSQAFGDGVAKKSLIFNK